MKKILMVHEQDAPVPSKFDDWTITFDDGLASQYEHFDMVGRTRIYYIITGYVGTPGYMTWDQIKRLTNYRDTYIGAHSHMHERLDRFDCLRDKVTHIKKDTNLMIRAFKENLGYVPRAFAFPYNDDLKGVYKALIKHHGFDIIHGAERYDINQMSAPLQTPLQPSPLLAPHDQTYC